MKRTLLSKAPEAFPQVLEPWIKGAPLYDSSCSREARVYYIEKEDGLFLKSAPPGDLEREALLNAYFHSLGLGPEVLLYQRETDRDYLLTRRVPGEDCTHLMYRERPKKLCDTTAALLRKLHETPAPNCPVPDRNASYRQTVEESFGGAHYEADLFKGLWEFASYEEAEQAAREGFSTMKTAALIHGDYCLPNIILKDWKLSGYIDVGNGGLGDRHIDILWGIWTLNYNLKTTRYTERFLDAYGRDLVEPEKLRSLAAMEMIGG